MESKLSFFLSLISLHSKLLQEVFQKYKEIYVYICIDSGW
jgi:hypothetical protein